MSYILGVRDITRIRRTKTAPVGGRASAPSEVESTIRAAVQPAGNKVSQLPQGIREIVSHVCYSYSELRATDDKAGVLGDRIEFGGDTLEVVICYPRTGPATLSHWEAYMQRVT